MGLRVRVGMKGVKKKKKNKDGAGEVNDVSGEK